MWGAVGERMVRGQNRRDTFPLTDFHQFFHLKLKPKTRTVIFAYDQITINEDSFGTTQVSHHV